MPEGMGFTARKILLVNPWDVKSAPTESRRYILALKCKVLRRFFIKEAKAKTSLMRAEEFRKEIEKLL